MRSSWIAAVIVACSVLCLSPAAAWAHFPWFATDEQGHALYFFGENIAERDYKLPESLASAEVTHIDGTGAKQPVKMDTVDSEEFIGRRSAEKVGDGGVLRCTAVYGIYHGSKLTYHMQHLLASDPAQWSAAPAGDTDLQATVNPNEGGVKVQVTWQGKPLPGVEVHLFCDEGHEEGLETTDDKGEVSFGARAVEGGLNGVLVGHTEKDQAGDHDGKPFKSTATYLTVTFVSPD